ncbi:MAG: hypothetical protein ACM3VZ_14520 [Acidobacteriota bacterium]
MAAALLSACGGGGGGSSPNADAGTLQNADTEVASRPTVDGQTLDGTLSYKGSQTSVYQLNLGTGQTLETYNENTSAIDEEERRAALRFSVDATGQARVIYRDHGVGPQGMRIWAKRYSGPSGQTWQSLFDVSGNHFIDNKSIISPDNRHLMLLWQADAESPITLRIVNTQGEVVNEWGEPAQFTWLPDGRALILDTDLSIWVTSADFATVQSLGRLSDTGTIRYFTPSPDGQRVAWVGPDNKVRASKLDGSAALLVADVREASLPVRELTWSPDGKAVAFNHPKAANLPGYGWTGGCEAIWVVPSTMTTVIDTYANDTRHMLIGPDGRFLCVGESVVSGVFVFLDWH